MSNHDYLTDEYVAELLAKDARESSIKYSSMGLQAFTSKPPTSKLKPNTRFLRNIIKCTDHHNAVLLAKETAEARERLLSLPCHNSRDTKIGVVRKRDRLLSNPGKETQDTKNSVSNKGECLLSLSSNGARDTNIYLRDKDVRKRQLGDIAEILQGKTIKRKRTEESSKSTRRTSASSEDQEVKKKSGSSRKEYENSTKNEKYEKSPTIKDRRFKSIMDVLGERKRHEEDRKKRFRSSSPKSRVSSYRKYDGSLLKRDQVEERERRNHHLPDEKENSRYRSCEKEKRRYRSNEREKSHHRSHRSHRDRSSRTKETEGAQDTGSGSPKISKLLEEIDSESDPLDEIIGPKPAFIPEIKPRGRGAASRASGIDLHFSEVYDPSADIQLDLDEMDDWDQALEAFRDRQKFKEKGLERLKSAGFTDKELQRLERGRKSPETDFKWAIQGESREWDRGKLIDSQGETKLELKFSSTFTGIGNENNSYSNYGRLKGT